VKNKKYHSSFSIFILSVFLFIIIYPTVFFLIICLFSISFLLGGGGKRKDNVQIGLVNDCDCMCVCVCV
jgi:hypothetical protein